MMMMLPEEFVHFEILTWLPEKDVARCKCVCKSWRSAITSRHFFDTYRNRNGNRKGCLMLYWSEDPADSDDISSLSHLRFYYCPLSRLKDETEEFRQLHVPGHNYGRPLTPLVNGLICVETHEGEKTKVTIHNVFSGESMTILRLFEYQYDYPSFHLGYDPVSRRYKLLRIKEIGEVDIMTIRPSTSVSEWRKLKFGDEGIKQVLANRYNTILGVFSGDGVLCWLTLSPNKEQGILLFDLNCEIFRWVKLPTMLNRCDQKIIPRAQLREESLALSLWVGRGFDYFNTAECFVLEDDEGEIWRQCCLSLPEELGCPSRVQMGTASGSFFSDDGGNGVMLVSAGSGAVYCTNRMGERLWVGKIPVEVKCDSISDPHLQLDEKSACFSHEDAVFGFGGRLSYLLDTNYLRLSLDQVLSGSF